MKSLFDGMTHFYDVDKTLVFKLEPVGETDENIRKEGIILADEKRTEDAEYVKEILNKYHRNFIVKALSQCRLEGLKDYQNKYNELSDLNKSKSKKSDSEEEKKIEAKKKRDAKEKIRKELKKYQDGFSKSITNCFNSQIDFETYLSVSKMIKFILENPTTSPSDRNKLKPFRSAAWCFNDYNKGIKNMYPPKIKIQNANEGTEINTSKKYKIYNRIVNDNLSTFIKNCEIYNKNSSLFKSLVNESNNEDLKQIDLDTIFDIEYFNNVINQEGIDQYNKLIGGYVSNDNKTKVQALNELINLHNQKDEEKQSIKQFNKLKKQILFAEENNAPFITQFNNDEDMCSSIESYYNEMIDNVFSEFYDMRKLFSDIESYGLSKIIINSSRIEKLCREAYGESLLEVDNVKVATTYSKLIGIKKKSDYTLEKIIKLICNKTHEQTDDNKLINMIKNVTVKEINLYEQFIESYNEIKDDILEATNERSYMSDDNKCNRFKRFMDSGKQINWFVKLMSIEDSKLEFSYSYYEQLSYILSVTEKVNSLYNSVRNYLTQNAYSKNKLKITFDASDFCGGWASSKETDYLTTILKKDNRYFLAIINKNNRKIFENAEESEVDYYEKMEYNQIDVTTDLPGWYLRKIDDKTVELKEGKKKGKADKNSENFDINFLHRLIDHYKECLANNRSEKFVFSDTNSYQDINDFYKEVFECCYTLKFSEKICSDWINRMVKENKIYLFQFYNKDFSEHSKGRKNLHTMYFEAVFSKENNKMYKLSGGAKIFYRPKSLSINEVRTYTKKIINSNNEKSYYTIYKDRRFTKDQYQINLPIKMNYCYKSVENINPEIRKRIKKYDDFNIIGVDRGERNLIYISVIDLNGNILKQQSLNEIVTNHNQKTYRVNYNKLLDERAGQRDSARKSWKQIKNIKEIKKGYLSFVVSKFVDLMLEYNAIIVLEDLNVGFKNNRKKVDKQIYQKFEEALIDKLQNLVRKDIDENEQGGLNHPLQLVNKTKKLSEQNGVIFFVPAGYTSAIDPVTGFVNKLPKKYETISNAITFFNNFKDIRYNEEKDYFEFELDYQDFEVNMSKSKWTLCTYGTRLYTKRRGHEVVEYDLVKELKSLFEQYGINYTSNLKEQILNQTKKDFFDKLYFFLCRTLQIRNRRPNSDEDYIISPVCDQNGNFYDSRKASANLPCDADANGAYNIARKGLILIRKIKELNDEDLNMPIYVSFEEYTDFVQNNE